MDGITYTKQQYSDARRLYDALQSNPPDRKAIAKIMANTFINGMNAQDRLSQSRAEQESA